ncbi:DUF4625 domain-containing protein [Reichenbachiella versicolor]|uniref:DUF4625 domain-containing protein n=1 Tax=Reichenbachiella versicolor TaxID=1821036 RepID=UPI000D6DDDC5|nr:DUF4625 domain-containing protein [Reichenbachiella versicolor]
MKYTLYVILIAVIVSACIEEKDTEIEQPVIELLSPSPCDTLRFGESFNFRVKITDNTGLGNISMDVHHNFGHHNHGVHESCDMDEKKDAVNPYSNGWVFSLPEERKEYVFDTGITFPAMKDETTNYDTGDYHFHIYVTDNDGYQVFTTLDIKVLDQDS